MTYFLLWAEGSHGDSQAFEGVFLLMVSGMSGDDLSISFVASRSEAFLSVIDSRRYQSSMQTELNGSAVDFSSQ